jgi:hypothetical protein
MAHLYMLRQHCDSAIPTLHFLSVWRSLPNFYPKVSSSTRSLVLRAQIESNPNVCPADTGGKLSRARGSSAL